MKITTSSAAVSLRPEADLTAALERAFWCVRGFGHDIPKWSSAALLSVFVLRSQVAVSTRNTTDIASHRDDWLAASLLQRSWMSLLACHGRQFVLEPSTHMCLDTISISRRLPRIIYFQTHFGGRRAVQKRRGLLLALTKTYVIGQSYQALLVAVTHGRVRGKGNQCPAHLGLLAREPSSVLSANRVVALSCFAAGYLNGTCF